MKFYGLALTVLVFAASSAGAQNLFRQIRSVRLLKATRDDVSRLLGEPSTMQNPYYATYKTPEGDIAVEFSRGPCSKGSRGGWDVPEFTATRIFFDPAKRVKPRRLGLSIGKFKRHAVSDVPGAASYEDAVNGISFVLRRGGTVETVDLYPGKKFSSLLCRDQ